MSELPSRQEMFDRAVIGLRSQGFQRAHEPGGCVYQTHDGLRCAWGWIDMSLDRNDGGSVSTLRSRKRGIAEFLNADDADWAAGLQSCHDMGMTPDNMVYQLVRFADRYGLIFPEAPSP